ncbi:MAG TPA: hypothetical protein VFA68_10795 [Terriglobales bacterium]|nr:hypothetical protein [Terriglobales bacterium]
MNRLFLFALAFALSAGAATSVFTASGGHARLNPAAQQNGAAFRDGMYLGKLDAESGRNPHFIASRWTSQEDRSAFLQGYEAVYGKVGNLYATRPSSAELVGFHDGISDGLRHRQTSHKFQVNRTENYRHAGGIETSATDLQQNYRQAYVNGYQQGFYGEQQTRLGELSEQASF